MKYTTAHGRFHDTQSLIGGYVVIFNTFVFIAVITILVLGIVRPVLATHAASNALVHSKQAFLVAGSAADEAMFRLKRDLPMDASETLELASGAAEINTADTSAGKTVTIDAQTDEYVRSIQVEAEEGEGVSFNYGLQAGKGGFIMSGGAGINGNVYANGDIVGSGGPYITGSATVANASDPEAHISSAGPDTPSEDVLFAGRPPMPNDAAQQFSVATTAPITSMRAYMKKGMQSWMNNMTVRIVNDDNGQPSGTTIASGTIDADAVTTSYNHITVPFTSAPELVPDADYWLVFDSVEHWNDDDHYAVAGASGIYENGSVMRGEWHQGHGGSWSDASPNDVGMYFDLYIGGDTGLISGVTVGSGSNGDAWAHEIRDSDVAGVKYCQVTSGDSEDECDTSRPDPTERPLPVSDGNIADWKNQAEAGETITGGVDMSDGTTDTIGPAKIEGDLTLTNAAELALAGTVWVTGDVSVSGDAEIRLDSSYGSGSGIFVADGRVSVSGGGRFEGSGTPGSYLLTLTTSACPDASGCGGSPAVQVSGGTGSVILNAQNGTIQFSGSASAKQATAHTIEMSGGAEVTYETGLADPSFTSGPSGSWNVVSWREL